MSPDNVAELKDRRASLKQLAALRDDSLFDLAYKYIAEANILGDNKLATYLKLDLAGYYNSLRSDHKKANSLLEEILPEIEKANDPFLLATINKRLGSNAYFLSDFAMAAQCFNEARQIIENIEPKTDALLTELADLYNNLSFVYRTDEYDDYRKELNNKALGIGLTLGDMTRVARSYNLMGNMLLDKEQHEDALHLYLQALEIFESNPKNNDTNITYCYNNIATCYTNLKQYDKALSFLNKSLAIRQAIGTPNEVAVTLMITGVTHKTQGNHKESESYFLQAIDIFRNKGNTYDTSYTALQLAELYQAMKDFEKATEYLNLHLSLQNELNKEDKRRAIAEALAAFKLEQKEAETKLLKQKNAEIENFANKLETSNKELNQFAHIVSHDLKEPLRMIAAYTGLLKSKINIEDNADAEQFMGFITQGTERMSNLINELLEYSKVGATCKIQTTPLNQLLEIVRMNLSGLLHEKNGNIEAAELPIIDCDRTMMLQLFQNLLGNGLKYNTSAKPTVGIKYVTNKDTFELHFYDNGIGIPVEFRQKVFDIFRRLPDSKDIQGTGIGLSICHKIITQLKGKIWIEDNQPQGTVFIVQLPKVITCP